MIVILDNYDSFTFNLLQYLGEITHSTCEIRVLRNDAVTVQELASWKPSHIVISPGPCTPNEAGISLALVRELAGAIPILGVCLGHQAIVQAFGGKVVRAPRVLHGKTSIVRHNSEGIFAGIPSSFRVTRYHSLIAEPASLPSQLRVIASVEDFPKEIMAVVHRDFPSTVGVQFHPEAILTEYGKQLLNNFFKIME